MFLLLLNNLFIPFFFVMTFVFLEYSASGWQNFFSGHDFIILCSSVLYGVTNKNLSL